jgi:hypothetical protein
MKILTVLLFSLCFLTSYSQEIKTDSLYTFPAPANWSIERFPIPIGFAPTIPYKGVEDIRFTPGWAKAKTDEYWTYAFLWYLEGDIKMDAKTIESNLQQYYSGLITANGIDTSGTPVASFKELTKKNTGVKTFSGTIDMLDYMAKQPIKLHCKVHVKSSYRKTNTYMFYELSPKPLSHDIWKSLDALWTNFKCKK